MTSMYWNIGLFCFVYVCFYKEEYWFIYIYSRWNLCATNVHSDFKEAKTPQTIWGRVEDHAMRATDPHMIKVCGLTVVCFTVSIYVLSFHTRHRAEQMRTPRCYCNSLVGWDSSCRIASSSGLTLPFPADGWMNLEYRGGLGVNN
jgi:hypothetical protein